MKKTVTAIFLAVAILGISLCSAACSKQPLAVPENIVIDDTYKMTWEDVENSRGYTVSITDAAGVSTEEVARRANYSLISLATGDYEIRVKAVASQGYADSPWSEVIYFHRDYENGCFYQKTSDGMAFELTSYGTSSGNVDVGDTYRGKPVVRIGDAAFRSSRVTGVIVGSNVVSIGDSAFYGCAQLTSVTIPGSVTEIGAEAFQACYQLDNVVIPDGVTILSDNLFNYCRSLTNINVPEHIVSIGTGTFANCSALRGFEIPDAVEEVGSMAFLNCSSLESVSVGDSVAAIGEDAFRGCVKLGQVEFSDKQALKTIGGSAFYECTALTEIAFPEGLESIGGSAYCGCSALAEVQIPESVEDIGQFAFLNTAIYDRAKEAGETYVYADSWLVEVVESKFGEIVIAGDESTPQDLRNESFVPLRSDIRGIASAVFYTCPLLERVFLPDSVEIVGNSAFSSCDNLWYFEATDSSALRVLDIGAFIGCGALRTVYLGNSLEVIEPYAFYDCAALDNNSISSIIPASVRQIGNLAFYGTALYANADEYGVIYAGDWVVGYEGYEPAMYYMAYMSIGEEEKAAQYSGQMSKVSYVQLSSETRGIADFAFYGHINLEQVDGMSNARYMGKGAFYGCESLSIVNINSNATAVEDYTFYGCEAIFRVSLPPLISSVGRSAFYGCTQLSEVNYTGTRLTSIGDFAFYNCINLPSLNFGRGLEEVGRYAFYNCTSLEEIALPDTVLRVSDCAFYRCSGAVSLSLGANLTEIGSRAFGECTSLTSLSIPASVKKIGDFAFYGCTGILSLELNNGLEEIGNNAFANLTALQDVALPESLRSLGAQAFRGCVGLRSVVIRSDTSIGEHAFYGDLSATIYTDAAYDAVNREGYWNSSYRPVFFSCVFSEEGYLLSFEITQTSMQYINERTIAVPVRSGYTFAGWEDRASGTVYAADEIGQVPAGTTLYAVWEQA